MADFSKEKKYDYNWQNSKFKDLLFAGSNISNLVNDVGYITSSVAVSASYALSASYASTASYFSGSVSNAISASYALTASYVKNAQTASYVLNAISASYALTASYSQNLVISGSINNVDYIDFTTDNIIGTNAPAWKEGRLFYDSGSGALAMYNWEQDVTLNIGQEQWLRARNQTGVTITNGTVVRLLGAIGDRPTIALAQAVDQTNTFSVSNEIIGMATHDIEHGTDGFVTTFGLVNGINTAAFNAGDILWVSQSAGQFTNIPPPPPIDRTFVGIVTRKNANNGTVFMTPLTPIHFHDISSVSASAYTMGDLWMYRSGSVGQANAWINTKALTGSYSISGSLTAASITGSLHGTSSWALNAQTASYVTNLNQPVTIGNITSTPSNENTLNIYPSPAGGTGEGGQILLAASGGLYTSASMLDTWQNYFRILRGTNTGGSNAQLLGLDLQTGNLSIAGAIIPSAWTAGQVIKDTMLSNTEVTVSTTTIATSTSDTDFVTYSYTPVSSNSYLVIHYHLANYDFSSGTGNDSYISRIKVDGSEITYSTQSTVNGNRSPVLFPLTGRYTNSSTAAKSIVVACRRNSADDSITITNSSTSMWLRITEIAR